MSDVSRREFLKYSAAAATTAVAGAYVFSVFGGTIRGAGAGSAQEAYDLLIKGGEVLDPGQSLRDALDVAISNGRISAVEADISEDDAREVIQADGKLVVPGLIDMHAHVYPEASGLGLPADELVPQTATTTYVSAGDAGANNFSGLDHWVIGQSRSRIFGRRAGHRSGPRPRHHRQRHPRRERQHRGHAVLALGHEQVPQPGLLP